jgi:PIN domain nuclease of toxin-antitoxin system
MPAVLDTHAAIWYLLDAKNLSQTVLSLIDGAAASGAPTYISAVSLVEVVYLVERGRIAADAFDRFVSELGQDNPAFTVVPLDSHIAGVLRGISRNVAPDMPATLSSLLLLSISAFPSSPATAAFRPPESKQSGKPDFSLEPPFDIFSRSSFPPYCAPLFVFCFGRVGFLILLSWTGGLGLSRSSPLRVFLPLQLPAPGRMSGARQ